MSLSNAQKRHLRSLAHHLDPVVRVGQHGVTEGVMRELEQALDVHELVKVKIAADRDERRLIGEGLCARTGAEQVQSIGQMIVLFRRNPDKPRVVLPSG